LTAVTLYTLLGVALFGLGLYGLIAASQLIRKVMAFNIAGSGAFLFLVALAYRIRAPFPDPVPHAMVLTGIVVAVSATALALLLICRLAELSGPSSAESDDQP
jgi:multicomponent Na+:H+ antiporter subunit C